MNDREGLDRPHEPEGADIPLSSGAPSVPPPPPVHVMTPADDFGHGGPAAPPPPPETKGGHLWLWILGIVLALVVIVAVVLGLTRERTVEMPDVTGLSLTQTVAALAEAGLRLGEVSYTSQIPVGMEEGQTVAQDPAAGTRVEKDSAVNLMMAGQAQVEVPQVTGLTVEEATQTLEAAGFVINVVQVEDEAEAGTVVDQSPEAGSSVVPGSEVTLVVSAGKTDTLVPRVVGMTQEEAATVLAEAGYEVQAKGVFDEQAEKGIVISQEPEAGTVAEPGTRVDIFVSQGKNPEVEVPNVVGMSETGAFEALQAAGLEAVPSSTYSEAAPVGQVISQEPEAGTTARRGDSVAISVSQGPAPPDNATVPNVIGQTEDEAVATLQEAGYQVAIVSTYSELVPADIVGVQAPLEGTITEPGITVAIVVSDGPRPVDNFVIVPDLRGLSLDEATAALDELGLEAVSLEFFTDLAPASQVAAHLPPPESYVSPGATILLLVSKGPYPQVNPL